MHASPSAAPGPRAPRAPRPAAARRPPRTWWWRIGPVADAADLAALDRTERARLDGMRSAAQAATFVSCRAAVRRVLAGLLDTAPEQIRLGRRPCPGCGDTGHGPPTVTWPETDWWISLSHTAGCGVLAVADAPVGVDVERHRAVRTHELARVALTAAERRHVRSRATREERDRAFLRCWTRGEAALKAVGVGLTVDLTAVETHPAISGTVTVTLPDAPPGSPAGWSVTDLSLPGPWTAALAVPAGSPAPELPRAHGARPAPAGR